MSMMYDQATPAALAAAKLQSYHLQEPVAFAVIVESGFNAVIDILDDALSIPYSDLPGFPDLSANGEEGLLVTGLVEGQRIVVLIGQSHFCDTGDPSSMASSLETLALLGIDTVLLTGVAVSLNVEWNPGNLIFVKDHINLNGFNPLIGSGLQGNAVAMHDAYDPRLRASIRKSAEGGSLSMHEGVYMWFSGPTIETPAEISMARKLGAELAGNSIVGETILARRLGLRVAAIVVISSFGAGLAGAKPTAEDAKRVAVGGTIGLKKLLRLYARGPGNPYS